MSYSSKKQSKRKSLNNKSDFGASKKPLKWVTVFSLKMSQNKNSNQPFWNRSKTFTKWTPMQVPKLQRYKDSKIKLKTWSISAASQKITLKISIVKSKIHLAWLSMRIMENSGLEPRSLTILSLMKIRMISLKSLQTIFWRHRSLRRSRISKERYAQSQQARWVYSNKMLCSQTISSFAWKKNSGK